jgi:hypothetical protein
MVTVVSGVCGRADPPPEPASNCPRFADIPANYEKPKTPGLSDALDRCLTNLRRAQQEVCALYAEGKVQRHRSLNGPWVSGVTLTNSDFTFVFLNATGPVHQIGKRVLGDNSGPSERGYRIEFYEQGKVRLYTGLRGRHIDEAASFHPNGGIERFRADIDRSTSGEATWNADGKLQSEGLSPQLPKDAEGLPELEDVLRHGNDEKKTEAILAMMQIGIDSIPYALNVLKDGDELSRERAAFLFGLLAARAHPATSDTAHRLREEAVPALARLLREDKSAKVRGIIAQSLGSMGPAAEAAIPALEQAATNDVPEVANTAKASLGRIRGPSSK